MKPPLDPKTVIQLARDTAHAMMTSVEAQSGVDLDEDDRETFYTGVEVGITATLLVIHEQQEASS